MSRQQPAPLETVSVTVPEDALEVFEAALSSVCTTVGFFRDDASGEWRVEGVRQALGNDAELAAALALARGLTGLDPPLERAPTPAEGWLARTLAGFPEQLIGRRFAVRGAHITAAPPPGRIVLTLDAGLAFGSGEHGSTRGCLLALESVAWRRPRRILDLGTGSGILAIAAVRTLHRPVLATDIEPWAVRVAQENAADNGAGRMVSVLLADGWHDTRVRRAAPFDLVFANILARPLCAMAKDLALHLRAGGTAILSGLLKNQARSVVAAHRRCGMVLERAIQAGAWTTLVLRRAGGAGRW
jgi:ribosomal protein L11 methyltransferase